MSVQCDGEQFKHCGRSWATDKTVIYTVKTNLARGWRGHFCAEHLIQWIAKTPMVQQNGTVTITNDGKE